MPDYVPSERCLNAIYTALGTAGLLNLPGDALLIELDNIAEARWPLAAVNGCDELAKHPRSRALATSLALLWPLRHWDAAEARHEFRNLATDLIDAWKTVGHNPDEMLRKTVDHTVVAGVRRNWASARDVLTFALVGDARKYLPGQPPREQALERPLPEGPLGASLHFLRGRRIAKGMQATGENVRGRETDGLIPDLDRCWGWDIRQDIMSHAGVIYNKLLQPFIRLPGFSNGENADFTWQGDDVLVPFSNKPVQPGSRRNFRLASGTATLLRNNQHFAYVAEGQRLMLRVLDDNMAELQLAQLRGGSVGGRKLEFEPNDTVRLTFSSEEGSILEVWNCTCGTWACHEHHRLAGWDIRQLPAAVNLSSFLWTAVKGPQTGFHIKSFIQGMYYAVLCDGE